MIKTLKQHQFLFRELVKRDFRQKYKKTTLGVIWSILNPLAEFLVLMLIFKNIFSRNTPHYTIYMLVGILNYTYFNNATHTGMQSFLNNAGIIQKIKVPTWIFPLSKNVSALFNFFITLVLLIPFMIYDHMGLHGNWFSSSIRLYCCSSLILALASFWHLSMSFLKMFSIFTISSVDCSTSAVRYSGMILPCQKPDKNCCTSILSMTSSIILVLSSSTNKSQRCLTIWFCWDIPFCS